MQMLCLKSLKMAVISASAIYNVVLKESYEVNTGYGFCEIISLP
jgi:hypothetical protein